MRTEGKEGEGEKGSQILRLGGTRKGLEGRSVNVEQSRGCPGVLKKKKT